MTTKYIIARYSESIGWLHPILSDCIIFNKGKKLGIPYEHLLPNVGRESETYLRFIIENYDDLPDCCVFSQGKIKDHMERVQDLNIFLISAKHRLGTEKLMKEIGFELEKLNGKHQR